MVKDVGNSGEYKSSKGASLYILIICSLLYMVGAMDRQVLAAVVEPIKAALNLSDTEIGVLGTIFLISAAILAPVVAYIIDRWSRRKAIGIMAIIWSIFTFFTGISWNFGSLLVARSGVAVGEAGFSAGGTAMIGAAYSSKSRGVAMGIFNMALILGLGIGTVLAGLIAKAYGWQAPFFYFAIPGIILGILALFMKDYKSVEKIDDTRAKVTFGQSIQTVLKIPTLIWALVGIGLASIMIMAFLFWAPAYIGRAWGVDVAAANAVMVPIILISIVSSPLSGILADLWFRKDPRGRLYIPAISMILSTICLAGALYFQMKGIGMALVIAYGFFSSMIMSPIHAVSQDVAPIAQKGMVWGTIVFCMYLFGGGWSPYLVGAISNALGQGAQALGTALTIASLGGILGGVCYFMASRPYIADMRKVEEEQLIAEK